MKNMYYFCGLFITNVIMEIGQFLGFLVFLTVFTMGFWMLIFLLTTVVPYWLFGNLMESWKLKKEAKKAKSK
ncbi:hypothetical protein [Lutimonas halocynthiae]|uniref:hypothetical protein n=1 Tax=Lutimonas halocynthiae TaxID=1446477 RepID=UPI0025B4F487|nr:hypothetical protein [Lutimonas halocynthiae]